MPRLNQVSGSYSYVPRCIEVSIFKTCDKQDWVQIYSGGFLDNNSVICAKNTYAWENLNGNPNPGSVPTTGGDIGPYKPPP